MEIKLQCVRPAGISAPVAEELVEQTEWLTLRVSIIFVGSLNLSIDSYIAEDVQQNLIFPWLIVLHLYLLQYIVLGYRITLELLSQ